MKPWPRFVVFLAIVSGLSVSLSAQWPPYTPAGVPKTPDGNPLTDAAKLTERFRRPNYGTLEIDVTVDDPKAYTKPWTVRVNQRLMLDTELSEFICLENQKFDAFLKGQK